MSGKTDLQGILLASMQGCLTSLEAYLPLTEAQYQELYRIYLMLLYLQNNVAWGEQHTIKDSNNG